MFDPDLFDAETFDVAEFIASRKTSTRRAVQPTYSREAQQRFLRPANVSRGTR